MTPWTTQRLSWPRKLEPCGGRLALVSTTAPPCICGSGGADDWAAPLECWAALQALRREAERQIARTADQRMRHPKAFVQIAAAPQTLGEAPTPRSSHPTCTCP